jgi:hypothetical protein
MVSVHVLKPIPQLTAVALLYAQQLLQVSASYHENMDNETTNLLSLSIWMLVCVILMLLLR